MSETSTQATKGPTCVGHRETEGTCANTALHPANPRRRRGGGPFWCDGCEQRRRDYIGRQLESMLETFNHV